MGFSSKFDLNHAQLGKLNQDGAYSRSEHLEVEYLGHAHEEHGSGMEEGKR